MLGESEALDLLEVLPRVLRSVARHRLAGQGRVARVDVILFDHGELAGVHLDLPHDRFEAPGQIVRVGIELDGHHARGLHLRPHHQLDDVSATFILLTEISAPGRRGATASP